MLSVHPFPAVNGTTVAGDLVLIIFKIKLIVITELFTLLYPAVGADNYLMPLLKCYHFSHTVRGT